MNLKKLADRAAYIRRSEGIVVPAGAAWRAVREAGLAVRPDAGEIVSDICRELQGRSTARQNKNKKLGLLSSHIAEQFDFRALREDPRIAEARRIALERGGDPDD